jgi:hypothetical protein
MDLEEMATIEVTSEAPGSPVESVFVPGSNKCRSDQYARFGNGSVSCFCRVPIRRLAQLLGWETFGGRDLAYLKRKTMVRREPGQNPHGIAGNSRLWLMTG